MSKPKKIPKFKSLREEQKFWNSHDSTDYMDWLKAKHVKFPNLKPTTKTVSLRLPIYLLVELKILANKEDVPYQSLMKMLLAQGVDTLRKHIEK